MTQRQRRIGTMGAILGAAVALVGLGAALRAPTLDALDIATEQQVDSLRRVDARLVVSVDSLRPLPREVASTRALLICYIRAQAMHANPLGCVQ